MIHRILQTTLERLATKYPVITLTGPRQSGKSTLLRYAFPNYQYISLEDLDLREFATNDPRGFLATYPCRVILDEVQRVPSLMSYIQTHVDMTNESGMYLLAGSHNFLLMESVNQSLSSRTAILKLLPFSRREMQNGGVLPASINEQIYFGAYPCLYDKGLQPDWNNFAKRLVKSPKLYFFDTGLACSLLEIKSPEQLDTHYSRGALFENMVINGFIKKACNEGHETDLRFWRDSQGNEVDLLLYDSGAPPWHTKSSRERHSIPSFSKV